MHASSSEPQPSPASPPKRKRRLVPRGRLARLLLSLLILLLAIAVATQIVFWTNVPRDLVLAQLQNQLGLRIEAASLSTGWLGDTNLRDVTIGLPLSDESLVHVPRMRVKHNSLFGLLWTRAVTLDAIELDGPHLVIRQDASGRWNLLQVAGLIARTGGKETAADQKTKTSRPKLPAVRVSNATLDVIDRGGRTTTIAPINVDGEPIDALTWKYDATAGPTGTGIAPGTPQLRLTGRLATGGTWEHEVRVYASRVEGWAKPWAGDAPPAVSLMGQWHGQLRPGGGVAGRLVIDGLDAGSVHAGARSGAGTEDGGVVALRPENLLVHTGQKTLPELRVVGGRILIDGKSVAAEALSVLSSSGAARVDGRCDWAAASGDVNAAWADFDVPGETITHGGSLTASVRHPFPGQPVVNAHLISNGKMPTTTWEADLALNGSGTSWSNVDWAFHANRLTLTGRQPLRLDGLAANVQTRGSLVALTSLRGPGEVTAKGAGQYNRATKEWQLRLDLGNLPRPIEFGREGEVAITLNARGSGDRIIFENPGLSIRGTEAEIRADGSYAFNLPKPLDFNLYCNHVPPHIAAADGTPIFRYLRGEAHVTGTVWPTDLDVNGTLVGRDVRFIDRSIGDIEAKLTGKVDDQHVTLSTSRLELLGGQWQLDALFPEHGVLGVNVSVDNLSLAEVGGVIKRPGLEGTADARLAFIVPRLDPGALKASGNLKAHSLKYGKFAADQLDGTLALADGSLIVDPIRLRKGAGQADLTAELDVRERRRITASLALSAWPFEPSPGTKAELWGGTTGLRVTLRGAKRAEGIRRGMFQLESKTEQLWVTGPIDLRAALTLKDQPLGELRLLADMRGRVLDLRSLSIDGLDGTVQGQGMVDFDRPLEARGSLYVEDFNAGRIPEFFPHLNTLVGLGGRFSGRATVAPAPKSASGPPPLEPLRIQANVTSNGGKYRSIDIGPIQFSAFTNLDRVVMQDSLDHPSTIELAGGQVRVWGRVSALEPGQELNPATGNSTLLLSQLQVSFKAIDLDQIVHAFAPDADEMVGKLNGSFEALAGTRPLRRLGQARSGQGLVEKITRRISADGRVAITESDLVNFDVVRDLYIGLGISPSKEAPVGYGGVTFHLEDGLLSLNNARYFNRGTELRGIADIDDVWRMPDSPISGTAVGTARPFKDIRVPFLSTYDLDAILTVLQTDLTTVRLAGTVRKPEVIPLAFKDLGEGMRNFILGDYQSERSVHRP